MNKIWLKYIIIVVCISLLIGKTFVDSKKNNARLTPPKGKILLIIGQYKEAIDTYIKKLGHIPAGIMVYTSSVKIIVRFCI